ncbi:MAG: chemotaxis protein CheA [Bryobacterales bacterium]|nr:chemotaxis protein CheA [Bryobacterales bacterium]
MPNSEMAPRLRERIDDLSTRLLIGNGDNGAAGAGAESVPAILAELSRQAGDAGYLEASRIAAELSAGGSASGDLEQGLARLQEALSESARPTEEAMPVLQPAPAPAVFSLAQDPELVADFVLESREHLTSIEQRLLTLEKEPEDADAINSVFRGFHTIKGLAGFLEFAAIQEMSHEVETALNLARDGNLSITPAVIDVILESVDYLRRAMAAVESGEGHEIDAGHNRLLVRVQSLMRTEPGAASADASDSGTKALDSSAAAPPSTVERTVEPAVPAPALSVEPLKPEPLPKLESVTKPEGDAKRAAAESSSVRVDTAKLDYLVDMVGEMVIAQAMVRHNEVISEAADQRLQRDLAQLTRITGEVQRTAMAMRMVPIGQLFQRTARQIRDLSRKVGKQIELVTRGEDTELDKTIAEELADPLMHMVRNSVDHGIEAPDERLAARKPLQAKVTLSAYHQAGQIVIEIADDGRGLDCQKILAKARQKGLVDDTQHLSENDIFRLILAPGFSTAEQITDISGRGVGMDVVTRQVERLRGRIEIRSQAGKGTTFLLKLPLTLAIIDGLVVTVGGHRYIVPLFSVSEMFRPAAETIFTVQNRQEMAMVRERLLPVMRLYKRFGIPPRSEDPYECLMVVAETEEQSFCLMVDDLVGKQEVVIKSLGESLGRIPGIAGGAILGDGRVGLILDMGGLWRAHAHV